MADLVQEGFNTVERLQQHESIVTGVPTGFEDIDEMTAGLQRADLVIIAARPSMGKTAFALNIGAHVAKGGERTVGLFSLEMAKEQLFMRLLTSEAQIDSHRFRTSRLMEKDYRQLSTALGRLTELRMHIDDTPGIGVLEMRAKARRLKVEHGLDLLIIDYIQLMQGRGRFENRTQELASISRALKQLAKELNVPVWRSRSSAARRSRAGGPTGGRSSPTCASRAPRAGRRCRHVHLPRGDVRADARERGRGRDHHRQAAERADRHGEARLPEGATRFELLTNPSAQGAYPPDDRSAPPPDFPPDTLLDDE